MTNPRPHGSNFVVEPERRTGSHIGLTDVLYLQYDSQVGMPIIYDEEVSEPMNFMITPQELKSRLDQKDPVVLLDVREQWEYDLAKIDGSVLIPLAALPHSLSRLDRNAEIIAICHHGMRSADATGFLVQQGFTKAKNLVGGIDAWSAQVDGTVPRY